MLAGRAGRGQGCAQPQKSGRNVLPAGDSPGSLLLPPARWVLGEARRFRGLPGLRRGEPPAETERERQRRRDDSEREREREDAGGGGRGRQSKGEATDTLTQGNQRGRDIEMTKQQMRDKSRDSEK